MTENVQENPGKGSHVQHKDDGQQKKHNTFPRHYFKLALKIEKMFL